jgi:hypothetical protein
MKETLLRPGAPSPAHLDEWLTSAVLLYWHFVDRGQFDDAVRLLRRVAAERQEPKHVKRQRYDTVNLVTALHLALWVGEPAWAAKAAGQITERSLVRRTTLWTGTEAAIQLARGDFTGARKKAKRAHRRLAPFADLMGVLSLEQRCWESVIARADAAIAREKGALSAPVVAPSAAGAAPPLVPGAAAMPVGPIVPAPTAVASFSIAGPESARWLGRGRRAGAPNGVLGDPALFPLPVSASVTEGNRSSRVR